MTRATAERRRGARNARHMLFEGGGKRFLALQICVELHNRCLHEANAASSPTHKRFSPTLSDHMLAARTRDEKPAAFGQINDNLK